MVTTVLLNEHLGYKKIKIDSLIYCCKLGVGQFGSVYLVKHPDFKNLMALKCISRQRIAETQLEKHVEVSITLA